MDFDLPAIANAARDSAIQTVHSAMNVRQRPSPFDATECHLKIAVFDAIRNALMSTPESNRFRLFDELKLSSISNIQPAAGFGFGYSSADHPFDLVIGYPLQATTDPWSAVEAFGIIELKKNFARDHEDARAFFGIVNSARRHQGTTPLRWVLLIVLVNGPADQIMAYIEERTRIAAKHGLQLICGGKESQCSNLRGVESVRDNHFDVLCFGDVI